MHINGGVLVYFSPFLQMFLLQMDGFPVVEGVYLDTSGIYAHTKALDKMQYI